MHDRTWEQRLQHADVTPTAHSTAVASAVALLFLAYQFLIYLDFPLLSPFELTWNALVWLLPTNLLLDDVKRGQLRDNNMLANTHAAKSEALRSFFGFGVAKAIPNFSSIGGVARRASMFSNARETTSDAPPGLGNWDNSCYQNSVLQGLAALKSLGTYLDGPQISPSGANETTTASLLETVQRLNDPSNNGRQLWTPAKLKSMSSWQQQDAQEYFSKIMDELDKEATKALKLGRLQAGLETAVQEPGTEEAKTLLAPPAVMSNPLEGLLAQRVACTSCGYTEGLSMIPFNCLTVPLGSEFAYSIERCLDEFTGLEDISEVECSKCTLLKAQQQLQFLTMSAQQQERGADGQGGTKAMFLPPEVRTQIAERLNAIEEAIENDDFSDKTIGETCQISKKARVSSTKTRQAIIARAPQSLVLHINRSVFDELTGVQRKNYANVRYPPTLNLGPWTLNTGREGEPAETDFDAAFQATQSLLSNAVESQGVMYRLRAVVTHYGRHENGHYIAYRTHPLRPAEMRELDGDEVEPVQKPSTVQWWRLSDEDVSRVSEQDVLAQGGVFMLFYDRVEETNDESLQKTPDTVAALQTCEVISTSDPQAAIETTEDHNNRFEDVDDLVEAAPTPLESVLSRDASVERFSTATNTEDESEATDYEDSDFASTRPAGVLEKSSSPPPSWLKTAHGPPEEESGFNNIIRPMAAT